jgi:hypothetical protein
MAKRQTRRSVSLRAEVFVRAANLAKHLGMPLSAMVEDLIRDRADTEGIAEVPRAEALDTLRHPAGVTFLRTGIPLDDDGTDSCSDT